VTVEGAVVLVTGGAGGIGAAAAELLLADDARLVVSYFRHAERAQRWCDRAAVVQADITQAADRARLLDAAPGLYGVVVFTGDPARGAGMEERSWQVNFHGPIQLAREAAERMKSTATPGAIVLTSTMQAVSLFPGSTTYAAPKAALAHAARILAKECRGAANIRVNVVSPGVTAAGMAEASIAAGKYDRYLEEGVIHRFGQALDVARAVRFFLEPRQLHHRAGSLGGWWHHVVTSSGRSPSGAPPAGRLPVSPLEAGAGTPTTTSVVTG
jgi:NAD(P)-dependent dehydrogenase (short-subunit alcohol dehydrogenase family)